MAGLFGDDGGQTMELAMLMTSFVVATLLTGLLYVFFTPAISVFTTVVNGWIAAGWVSDQGHDMYLYMLLIWSALVALVYLGLMVGTIIRSIVLKGQRGGYQ